MEVKRKNCIFCKNGKKFKGKEHVFPKWVLEHLSVRTQKGPLSETRKKINENGELIFENVVKRVLSNNNYVSPYVCDECNNGWMCKLESKVKPILLPLIMGTKIPSKLTKDEKELIARWAAKTTCVIDSVGAVENPTYIDADPNFIRESDTLPKGWAVFATLHKPSRQECYERASHWLCKKGSISEELEKKLGNYPKTTIQLGHLILLTVYLGDSSLVLKAVHRFHYPIKVNLPIKYALKMPNRDLRVLTDNGRNTYSENSMMYFSDTLTLEKLK